MNMQTGFGNNSHFESGVWKALENEVVYPNFLRIISQLETLERAPQCIRSKGKNPCTTLYWQGDGFLFQHLVGFRVAYLRENYVEFSFRAIRVFILELQQATLRKTTSSLLDVGNQHLIRDMADDGLEYFLDMENRKLPPVAWQTTMKLPERWN